MNCLTGQSCRTSIVSTVEDLTTLNIILFNIDYLFSV